MDDDQFILHTLDHWLFGKNNTGNLFHPHNFRAYIQEAKERLGHIDLVTADGSIDCSSNPNEQEAIVHHLHFAEAVMGLATLAPGGSLVLKMFTLFETCTGSMMFLLGCHFENLRVVKPATSKSGNAEVQ